MPIAVSRDAKELVSGSIDSYSTPRKRSSMPIHPKGSDGNTSMEAFYLCMERMEGGENCIERSCEEVEEESKAN